MMCLSSLVSDLFSVMHMQVLQMTTKGNQHFEEKKKSDRYLLYPQELELILIKAICKTFSLSSQSYLDTEA